MAASKHGFIWHGYKLIRSWQTPGFVFFLCPVFNLIGGTFLLFVALLNAIKCPRSIPFALIGIAVFVLTVILGITVSSIFILLGPTFASITYLGLCEKYSAFG